MEFEVLEQYQNQGSEKAKDLKQLQNEAQELKDAVTAKKAEYEEYLHKIALEGSGPDERKNNKLLRLSREVDTAKAKSEIAEAKINIRNSTKEPGEITKEDLLNAWNKEYTPKYRQEIVEPAVAAVYEAKELLEAAVKEYGRAVEAHENLREEVKAITKEVKIGGAYVHVADLQPEGQIKRDLFALKEFVRKNQNQ